MSLGVVASRNQRGQCSVVPGQDVKPTPYSQRLLGNAAGTHGPASRPRNAAPNDHVPGCTGPGLHAMRLHRCVVASGTEPYGRHGSKGAIRCNGRIPRSAGLGHNTQVVPPAPHDLASDRRGRGQRDRAMLLAPYATPTLSTSALHPLLATDLVA